MGSSMMMAQEVANLFGVSTKTIARWAKDGSLPFFETMGGHRRYPREKIMSIYQERSLYKKGIAE